MHGYSQHEASPIKQLYYDDELEIGAIGVLLFAINFHLGNVCLVLAYPHGTEYRRAASMNKR